LTLRSNGADSCRLYCHLKPAREVGLRKVLHVRPVLSYRHYRLAVPRLGYRERLTRADTLRRAVVGTGAENLRDSIVPTEPHGKPSKPKLYTKEVAGLLTRNRLAKQARDRGLRISERHACKRESAVGNDGQVGVWQRTAKDQHQDCCADWHGA